MTEMIDLSSILKNVKLYESFKEDLKNEILGDFKTRQDQVSISVRDGEVNITKGQLLINLIVKGLLVGKNFVLSKEDIFTDKSLTEDSLYEYFDKIIGKSEEKSDRGTINQDILNILSEIANISGYLNVKAGNSISLLDLVRLSVEDPEFRKIINKDVNTNMSYEEIEDLFNKTGYDIESYFRNRKDAELHPFFMSETGVNRQQLTQAFSMIGLKPDIEGNIIPHLMMDNYLTGVKDVKTYYSNAIGARKAGITNSRMVRRSGYLTRKVSLAMVDKSHNNNIKDCHSNHAIKYHVKDSKFLKQIRNRHYHEINSNGEFGKELKTVRLNDTDLIGKTIALRSPVTCEHETTCATCYGRRLSEINKDINTGLFATLTFTEYLTQLLLSAKHLLTTNSEKVEWPKKFTDYFSINMNNIYLKDINLDVKVDIIPLNERDEDEDEPYAQTIYIDGEKFEVPVYLYYDAELEQQLDPELELTSITIKGTEYEADSIFTFQARNHELIKSLEDIIDLIESSNHLGIIDMDGMVQKFNELVIDNKITIDSVHLEMVISVLIRGVDKKRPSFKNGGKHVPEEIYNLYYKILESSSMGKSININKEVESLKSKFSFDPALLEGLEEKTIEEITEEVRDFVPYKIVRISNAIMDGPLSKSLAFERHEEQLTNPDTYDKDEKSLMDWLYV